MLETREEVEQWLKQHRIKNYVISNDLTVDVIGGVVLNNEELSEIPVKFGNVHGSFDCSYNKLTSLNGAPQNVLHSFWCTNNELETLDGAPVSIKGSFVCIDNPLRSLGGIDTYIGTDFTSPPVAEIDCISRRDYAGNYHVNANDFNAKVQELKRIREEKALFESSIAKVLDTQPLGKPTNQAAEPEPQQARVKPKFKL